MDTLSSTATSLYEQYEHFHVHHLDPAACNHDRVIAELAAQTAEGDGVLRMQEAGRSTEGRSLNLISAGSGPRSVLLWSQMHGDESTATLALLDVLRCIVRTRTEPWMSEMLRRVSVHFMPMVNPDGAMRCSRENAVGIDINRDALAAVSPEARALRGAHERLTPEVAFNLHDQDLRSAGNSAHVAALALLAPPPDDRRSVTAARVRAMCLGARVAEALAPFVAGHIARYDDAFEPRAFGDFFQGSGTSTLLIESGHWPGDPEKAFIRKLNAVAILSALWCIASGSDEPGGSGSYDVLPPNGNRMFDLLVKGLHVRHPNGWTGSVDLGVLFERCRTTAIVKEIGDLRGYAGLTECSGAGRVLPPELMRRNGPLERHRLYELLDLPQGLSGAPSR